ncbi:nibrin isoform X2 [Ochlerotatus camptorhynchus]|uniref:nibrin isoform X2 n=1 Tax=Ochlerotatus camptorhynchus TaxID=644619 RepID=UPI0031E08C27
MWFLKNVQNGTFYYIRPNIAKHTVSRSTGELIIQGDPSISRNHAFLYPEPGTLKVIDAGSRYGTFINDAIETEREQIPKDTPSELKAGDRLRFGKCQSIWTVGKEDFDCITSTITVDGRLKESLQVLGGKVRDAFQDECTRYLIMKTITTTPKLLMCLIAQVPVVKPEYFDECVKAVERGRMLPNADDFIPEFTEAYVRSEGMTFGRVPSRKMLFQGKTFVFIKPKHMSQYEGIVKLAGGNCVCAQKRKIAKSFFTGQNVIVMHVASDSMSQTSSQAVDGLTQIVTNAGRRLIPDVEIGLAILHCSLEKYCNPTHKFTNVLDMETIPFTENFEPVAKNSEDCAGSSKGDAKESISIPETESRDSSQCVDVHKSLITESMDYSGQPLKISERAHELAKPNEKRKRVEQQNDNPKEVKKARSEPVQPKEDPPSQLEIPETPAGIGPSQASNFSGFLSVNHDAAVEDESSTEKPKQKRPLNLLLDDGEGDLFTFNEVAPKRAKRQATIAESFQSSQVTTRTATRHQAEDDLFSFDSGTSTRAAKQKTQGEGSVPKSNGTTISSVTAPSYKQFIKPIQIPVEGWLASTFCDLKIKTQRKDEKAEDSNHEAGDKCDGAKIKDEPRDGDEDQKTRVWEDGMEAMFQVRVKCMNLTSHRPHQNSTDTSFYSTGDANSTINGRLNFKAFVKTRFRLSLSRSKTTNRSKR